MNWTRALSAAVLSVALAGGLACNTNHRPDAPAVPSGPDYCFKDTTYTFTTVASDPDGDSIALRFDWGDSTASHWEGWFASGETVMFTHAWSDTGTYEVRVSAQDHQLTSEFSEARTVQVTMRLPPDTPGEPSGPSVGGKDTLYYFRAGAGHPDWLPVAIRFAWGDGDTSDWSEFVLPYAPVEMSHSWSTPGSYVVTAQAKDTGELTSLGMLREIVWVVSPVGRCGQVTWGASLMRILVHGIKARRISGLSGAWSTPWRAPQVLLRLWSYMDGASSSAWPQATAG